MHRTTGLTMLVLLSLWGCGTQPGSSAAGPAPALSPAAVAVAAAATPAPTPPPAGAALAAPVSCNRTATPAVTEGPYFKAGSPARTSLLDAALPGTRLTLTGLVLNASCQPVPGAVLDFWQADAAGRYDNTGFTLRGHQTADSGGGYRLETVIPGLYTGRTEHIHVKVQMPGGSILTTQLFFPDMATNSADGIYNPALLIDLAPGGEARTGRFDFVLMGSA